MALASRTSQTGHRAALAFPVGLCITPSSLFDWRRSSMGHAAAGGMQPRIAPLRQPHTACASHGNTEAPPPIRPRLDIPEPFHYNGTRPRVKGPAGQHRLQVWGFHAGVQSAQCGRQGPAQTNLHGEGLQPLPRKPASRHGGVALSPAPHPQCRRAEQPPSQQPDCVRFASGTRYTKQSVSVAQQDRASAS